MANGGERSSRSQSKSKTDNGKTDQSEDLLLDIRDEVKSMKVFVDDKIGSLEESLCAKIKQEISEVFENKIKEVVDKKLQDFSAEWSEKFKQFEAKLNALQSRSGGDESSELVNNIVIRNLPYNNNENLDQKVNKLIEDLINLKDVVIQSAVRKNSHRDDKLGVVIATCSSQQQKSQIMKHKKKLKDTHGYANVYIDHDKPVAQRVQESNWSTIVKTLASDKLMMRGCRVVKKAPQSDRAGAARGRGNNRGRGGNRGGRLVRPGESQQAESVNTPVIQGNSR